jgi:hypothetical protein
MNWPDGYRVTSKGNDMGYTTEFTGSIKLGRKLTFSEAKELVDLANNFKADEVEAATGIRTYMQWVPTESLDAIVWDGNEKFYEYLPLLEWLCGKWLKERGIAANGELIWSGESRDDVGRITVVNNAVEARAHPAGGKPLTAERLGRMALEVITQTGPTP